VLGLKHINAIFDTGTTMIIGDLNGITEFYAELSRFGALFSPEYGDGIYTSTWDSSAVDRPPHNV
jgi:hypothetical protein